MKFKYRCICKEEIGLIKNLWIELNKIHYKKSIYFKNHYSTFSFEDRIKPITKLSESEIRIEIVELDNNEIIAYSLSTIVEKNGVIDSLFLYKKYRGNGIGKQLVNNCIDWFNHNNCSKISLSVAEGNESVFEFYKKLGFYPRITTLQHKKNNDDSTL